MNSLKLGVGVLLGGCLTFFSPQDPEVTAAAASDQPSVVVGTYDSRAVVIAFVRSPEFSEFVKQLKRDVGSAIELANRHGDRDLVAALEAVGPDMQHRMHLRGFGGAPIDDVMARLEDRLPEIAAAAGVDVIVSRWELDWKSPTAKAVDVTALLAAEFVSAEKAREIVEQMKGVDLVPLEELQKHEHE